MSEENAIERLQAAISEHAEDIAVLKLSTSGLLERLVVIETQGQERERSRTQQNAEIHRSIVELTRQLAESTGAQKRDTELREQALLDEKRQLEQERRVTEKVRRKLIIMTSLGTLLGIVLSTLLSDQEVASYIWTVVLKWREPWAN